MGDVRFKCGHGLNGVGEWQREAISATLYPPWELFLHFCSYKTHEDNKNNVFIKVLRGV